MRRLLAVMLLAGGVLGFATPSYAWPAFAVFGAVVMFDFTNSSLTGDISSGLNATPGAPGVSG